VEAEVKHIKRLIRWSFILFSLWSSFLFVFSTVYPAADYVRQAAKSEIAHHGERYLPLQQIPPLYQLATIETEDHRFFDHFGIDIWGIGRALLSDIQAGHLIEGGSTITQQLIRNTLLTPEKTVSRKVKEVVLAIALERFMSKKEILELYFNVIYFGHEAYGVDQAAKVYFGKPISSLSLAEWSLLAGLPQAPSDYDPYKDFRLAKDRQQEVLTNLVNVHVITEKKAEQAINQPLHFRKQE
jgi:membrane peptidoglycan carboxypeptidase